jgi:hypothetical protein
LFARLQALACLLLFSGDCVVRSEPVVPADQPLVVYLKRGANRPGESIKTFRRELDALMRSAGYRLEWREAGSHPEAESAFVTVVELRGICQPASDLAARTVSPASEFSLGSTAVSDGQVLPFSWVNCEALTRVLAPALVAQHPARRDYLYGRAIARVVAHELYHVLTNQREHSATGLAKARFSVDELMANRFEFGSEASAALLTSGPER